MTEQVPIANFASALAIELRRSDEGGRDFVRFKFKNGTESDLHDLVAFGREADIPLTEFIYRTKVNVIYLQSHSKNLTNFSEVHDR
jgi:lysosomal acid phosphatase